MEGPEQRILVARVRQARAAVRRYGSRKTNRDRVSPRAEPDGLLEEGTLREVKVQLGRRYEAKWQGG